VKIGILSAAHLHVESYVPLLQNIAGVEVTGIADDDTERGRAAAQRFGIPFSESYAALLAERPDAVVVCSENSRHRALVELAAAAGAHVLCEKPLATNVQDARAVVDACRHAGVLLMTAFPMRFNAPLVALRGRLASGEFGRVYCFNGTNQGQMPANIRTWFVDPQLAGGGALMDHIVHLADVYRWYLGAEIVEVYAQANQILHAGEVEVETGGQVMLSFDNGVFATIDCSWSKPQYYPTWGGVVFEMVVEAGVVTVDAFRQNLTVYSSAQQRPTLASWGSNADAAMLREFVAAVREGRQPAVSGEDGLRAVEAVVAAYRSLETGQPVRIEGA
jgi:predicted dehydrogenase